MPRLVVRSEEWCRGYDAAYRIIAKMVDESDKQSTRLDGAEYYSECLRGAALSEAVEKLDDQRPFLNADDLTFFADGMFHS